MKEFLLTIHIWGAVATGVLVAASMTVLFLKKKSLYRRSAIAIAFGGAFQLLSGSVFALASSGTVFSFCVRIGLYSAVIIGAETLMVIAMHKNEIQYPRKLVFAPTGAGVFASFITFIMLMLR
ncbi:MAG: hypothetical protein A2934_04095 [Candidatus Sungbacteria bacterium RIFCSPLOWO2_01_FULL_47_10]|uniref:Uncharacterized protein n=1 Tax=Candidatus Sungbacteria bacterium RIFCSPLOWO2_01_FULL_47_10 TaxID=1802276 RepID=A0A1G2KZT1_9BACT|nr:MAG: hypothetical protein A2934_04095 [Candidatus Sungbacteria bacterium RIFCSPLOWO2_01_FULL_47_10]